MDKFNILSANSKKDTKKVNELINEGQKVILSNINQLTQYVDHVWMEEDKYLAELKKSLAEFSAEVEASEAKQKQIQECLKSLPSIN